MKKIFEKDNYINLSNITLNLIVLTLYNIGFKNDLLSLGEYITVTTIHCILLVIGLYCFCYHIFKKEKRNLLEVLKTNKVITQNQKNNI